MRAFCLICAAVVLIGCKPAGQGGAQPASNQGGAGVIDTMTQKSKLDTGRRVADQVRDIGAQQQQELDEVMGQ